MKSTLLFLLLLCCGSQCLIAQDWRDSITIRLKNDHLQKGQQGLYLHTDKTTYSHNETVWFTAYQLDTLQEEQNTLFIFLQNVQDHKIKYSARYVMKAYKAHGYLFLPNWLPLGEYRISAYTNIQLKYPGKQVAQQYISLIQHTGMPYSMHYRSGNNYTDAKGTYHLAYKLTRGDGKSIPEGNIKYNLLDEQGGKQSGKLALSSSGLVMIPVPGTIKNKPLQIYATVDDNKDTQTFYFPLSYTDSPLIKFYPESGHLVAGMKNRVAFELNSDTIPEHFRAVLTEDGKEVLTLTTDDAGRGSFEITPGRNSIYRLQSATGSYLRYKFPAIEPEGCRIAIASGSIDNHLTLNIGSTQTTAPLFLVIHNYKDVFYNASLQLNTGDTTLSIFLPLMPSGIAIVTLLDADGNPVAERTILKNAHHIPVASITFDSAVYSPLSAIQATIKIRDDNGNPLQGIFSLAAIKSSCLDSNRVSSLPLYYYAGRFLQQPGILPYNFLSLPAGQQDLILLTKFWTQYRWQYNRNNSSLSSLAIAEGISGRFLFKGKPLKKPVTFLLSKGAITETGMTDSSGRFHLPYNALYASADRALTICPVPSRKYSYIHAFSTYTNIGLIDTLNLALGQAPFIRIDRGEDNEADNTLPRVGTGSHTLKEVEIKAKKIDAITYYKRAYNKVGDDIYIGDCRRDYFCLFDGYLNCPSHSGVKPVDGNYYFNPHAGQPGRAYGWVKYIGCPDTSLGKFMATIRASWESKEFYMTDYNKTPPGEEQFSTTLYWGHELATDANGAARIRFFSNSLTGKFMIHIQGISNIGPFSGTCIYEVKDKGPLH